VDHHETRVPILNAAELILGGSRFDGFTRIIGIDGPDCAGKSTLADAIVRVSRGTTEIVHGDDFLFPAEVRAGDVGFEVATLMCDYFDWERWFDAVRAAIRRKPKAVIVEGVFLAASPVAKLLTERVWLELSPTEVFARAIARDSGVIGDANWVERHYREQCLPAQRIYQRFFRPRLTSDWVLDTSGGDDRVLIISRPE